jgi:hypothetical protein
MTNPWMGAHTHTHTHTPHILYLFKYIKQQCSIVCHLWTYGTWWNSMYAQVYLMYFNFNCSFLHEPHTNHVSMYTHGATKWCPYVSMLQINPFLKFNVTLMVHVKFQQIVIELYDFLHILFLTIFPWTFSILFWKHKYYNHVFHCNNKLNIMRLALNWLLPWNVVKFILCINKFLANQDKLIVIKVTSPLMNRDPLLQR